jgi:molybdopterin-binding protein
MIGLDRVGLRAGDFRLADVTLEVAAGAYAVLLGPSGAGKTLLLDCIAGLRAPNAGRVLLAGEDAASLPPHRRGVGYVMQGGALFPHRSVRQNIGFGPQVARLAEDVARSRVEELARLCGIADRLDDRTGPLSGGERQRVALARALAAGPRVLLLDEPLAALDPPARAGLREVLRRAHAELGTTTLHVTHDLEEAAVLGETVAVLIDGAIAQRGAPDEVFRRPATGAVARFCGVRNIFHGEVRTCDGQTVLVTPAGMSIRAATGNPRATRAVVSPEDVILARSPIETSAANRYAGRVRRLEARPPVCYVTVDTGAGELVAVVLDPSARALGLAEGAPIHAAFKATAVHLL